MGQCVTTKHVKHAEEMGLEEPIFKAQSLLEAAVNNQLRYLSIKSEKQLVYGYCLNILDNIPLDIIEAIFNHYSYHHIMMNPILIKYQKCNLKSYEFEYEIINSDQYRNQYFGDSLTTKNHKILLFGTPHSGKTTIFNQLRYIYQSYDKTELENIKTYLSMNIIESIRTLAIYSDILHDQDPSKNTCVQQENRSLRDKIARMSKKQSMTKDVYNNIIRLLNDKGIQNTLLYKRQFNVYQLTDSFEQIFENIDKYKENDYMLTFKDVLLTYKRSSEFKTFSFKYRNKDNTQIFKYEIHDVPGSKNYRRKWVHFFDNASVVMYIVNLDGYYRWIPEDSRNLEMRETIGLFRCLVNLEHFEHTQFVLVLNKMDLYKESIKQIDIKTYFNDFKGENGNINEGINFFVRKLLDQIRKKKENKEEKYIHCVVTNALNTHCIKNVFDYLHLNVISDQD